MAWRILLSLVGIALIAGVNSQSDCMTIDNCDSCVDKELECIACPGKALLVDGSGCNDCPSDCDECMDEGTKDSPDIKCTKCDEGFVLNAIKECTACSTGCQYCNVSGDSTACHTCYDSPGKYYARYDDMGTCLECPSNCKKCSVQVTDDLATAVCSSCITGYALKSDKSCTQCPPNCITCSVNSDGEAICSACSSTGNTKYVLDKTDGANKCLKCTCGELSFCNGQPGTPTTNSKCSKCPDAQYLTSTGACSNCNDGCATCETSPSTCGSCETGHRLSGTTCSPCVTSCDECKDGTTCDTCDESYGVTESALICEVCVDAYCNDCSTDAAMCDGCEDGYFHNSDNKCTPCTDLNCKTCDVAADMCTQCNGNLKVWNNECVDRTCSDPVCTDCSTDSAICAACPEGYTIVSDKCEECDVANCGDCDAGKTTCATGACKSGYGRIDDGMSMPNSITCQKCDQEQCNQCDGNKAQCVANMCIEGWTVATMVCAECDVANCGDCDAGKATCVVGACKSGYGHIDDGMSMPDSITCQKCMDTNCVECDTDKTKCTTCGTGYTVTADSAKTCEECSVRLPGCAVCNAAADSCTSCKPGLVPNTDNDRCYTCTIDGCTACSADNKCESGGCMAGYEYKAADMSCVPCDVNCDVAEDSCDLETDGTTTCYLCKTGYILNTDTKVCDACDANCESSSCTYQADEGVRCSTCIAGYEVNDEHTCDKCPLGCSACTLTDGKLTCDTCFGTHKSNSDVCVRCPTNCIQCTEKNGEMICDKCADKSALDTANNQCKACPSNCEKCTVSGGNVICQDCKDGYGLTANKQACDACSSLAIPNCKECTSANSAGKATCLSCQAGHTFKDGGDAECTACSSLTDCFVCQDKPNECTSCGSGYSQTDDGKCAYLCYKCSGDAASCGTFDDATVGNFTEPCFEGACFAYYDTRANANPAYTRGCLNQTCTTANENSKEECDDNKVCGRCCTGDKCNSWTLTGMDSGADVITHTLAVIMVTLATLGLLK